eukprot:5853494-Karenia_brevis.AAC.1
MMSLSRKRTAMTQLPSSSKCAGTGSLQLMYKMVCERSRRSAIGCRQTAASREGSLKFGKYLCLQRHPLAQQLH